MMRSQNFHSWFRKNPGWSAASAAVLVIAVALINSRYGLIATPQYAWSASILVTILGLALIGAAVNARPAGVLIDNRNRVSLSKFQATAWTVMVLSILVTAVGLNIEKSIPDALERIIIPPELLLAMGISATSLVATPILLSLKADQGTSRDAVTRTAEKLDLPVGDVRPTGRVFARSRPELASWADMFRGDETGNAGDADLSKVQQFLITLLLVGIYSAAAWSRFGSQQNMLPPLSSDFVWLMGVSHASYLIYKAVPHGGGAATMGTVDPSFEPVG